MDAFDLSASGLAPAKLIGNVVDFYAAAHAAVNGRDVFRSGKTAGERKTPTSAPAYVLAQPISACCQKTIVPPLCIFEGCLVWEPHNSVMDHVKRRCVDWANMFEGRRRIDTPAVCEKLPGQLTAEHEVMRLALSLMESQGLPAAAASPGDVRDSHTYAVGHHVQAALRTDLHFAAYIVQRHQRQHKWP
eukprot:364639-Chlamydomonas_euryale.AAC.13